MSRSLSICGAWVLVIVVLLHRLFGVVQDPVGRPESRLAPPSAAMLRTEGPSVELINHLRGVRVLCAVDAHGSFTAAARELGLTQSAVSQHVSTLERHLEVTLVERGSRPAALTEAGHALARHGRSLLARLEDAEQELAEVVGRRAGRLRLGSFPTALATFVPPALARFRDQRPGVRLTVLDDHLQALLPRLVRRRARRRAGLRRPRPDAATGRRAGAGRPLRRQVPAGPARTSPARRRTGTARPVGAAPRDLRRRDAREHVVPHRAGLVPGGRVRTRGGVLLRRLPRGPGVRGRRSRRGGGPRPRGGRRPGPRDPRPPDPGRRPVPSGAGGPPAGRLPDLSEPADDGDARLGDRLVRPFRRSPPARR